MKKETPVEWVLNLLTHSISLKQKHIDWLSEIGKAKEKQHLIDELEDVLYEDDKIDFDDPNYRKDVIEYGLTKVNNLKKELYEKS
jgi:hypothetical protein